MLHCDIFSHQGSTARFTVETNWIYAEINFCFLKLMHTWIRPMSRPSTFFHAHCFQFLWSASVPFGPISPLIPRGPGFPVMPFSPFPPRGPEGPVMPFSPLTPRDPVGPVIPISPLAPSRPSRPGNPLSPFKPLLQEEHPLHVGLKKKLWSKSS